MRRVSPAPYLADVMDISSVLPFLSLLVALFVGLGHSTKVADCCVRVDTTTRQFVDQQGRARIYHGVNVVYKSFPYYPRNSSFDPQLSLSQQDINFLQENGFNVVRLYVAWPGVEPSKGQYNLTYLDVLADFIETLGKNGIYTILDCHQDLWSPKFCGEGAPDYAALYMNRSVKPLKFPVPIPSLKPYSVDPETGYPYRNECIKHSFFTYYFCDAVGKTWQSLYDNEQNVQDHFAAFWQQVARHSRIRGNPYVLGYELVNEPWAGDIYGHLDQLEPHVADLKNLMPMYQKLHNSIRKVDEAHILFFEPTVIITSLPFKGFSSTGLTAGPGGRAYNDRQVLSYHIYCILLDKDGQPLNTRVCDTIDKDVVEIRMSDAEKLGVAGFLTEWGAYDDETVPGSKPYQDGLEIMGLADQYLQSWTYWQFKGYGDFTTQSDTGEGLWFANGTLQASKVKLLSRTYAQAVPGRYVSHSFDPTNGDFGVSFTANASLSSSPAIIYLNEKLYYPQGYDVSVSPTGLANFTTSHNQILVYLQPKAVKTGDELTVNITAK